MNGVRGESVPSDLGRCRAWLLPLPWRRVRETPGSAPGNTGLFAWRPVAALRTDGDLTGLEGLSDDHIAIELSAIHPGSVTTSESEGAYGRMPVRIATSDGNHGNTGIDCCEKARGLTRRPMMP